MKNGILQKFGKESNGNMMKYALARNMQKHKSKKKKHIYEKRKEIYEKNRSTPYEGAAA